MNWFYPPVKFDGNEWFILALIAMGWPLMLRLQRHFPRSLLILLSVSGFMSAFCLDIVLGWPPLDLYDINDRPQAEWFDMLLYPAYPPFGVLFLYMYTRLRIRGLFIVPYILLWSAFGTLVEWLAHAAGVFHYKGWNLWYSFATYLLLQAIHLWFYDFIGKWYLRTRLPRSPV